MLDISTIPFISSSFNDLFRFVMSSSRFSIPETSILSGSLTFISVGNSKSSRRALRSFSAGVRLLILPNSVTSESALISTPSENSFLISSTLSLNDLSNLYVSKLTAPSTGFSESFLVLSFFSFSSLLDILI
jgi:hypothetical protein